MLGREINGEETSLECLVDAAKRRISIWKETKIIKSSQTIRIRGRAGKNQLLSEPETESPEIIICYEPK